MPARERDKKQTPSTLASSLEEAKPSVEEWRRVVSAIETSLPVYDSVSERISLNKANDARKFAIEYLASVKKGWVVDVGVGPGASTRMLLDQGFESIAGVDPSTVLLKHTREIFPEHFHPIRAVSEFLPFRTESVDGVLTCFALRDVLDLDESLKEFGRVVKERGRFAIVDVGKPENSIERFFVSAYIRIGMPVVSWVLSWGRVDGNPFRMIVPTYERLVSNRVLMEATKNAFGEAELRPIMFGGLIVITAERART